MNTDRSGLSSGVRCYGGYWIATVYDRITVNKG